MEVWTARNGGCEPLIAQATLEIDQGRLAQDTGGMTKTWHDRYLEARSAGDHVSDKVSAFVGSWTFVYIHAVWFGFWILYPIEPFPYGLLTMIVSLEAIFLSCMVLISQNRQAAKEKIRSDVEYDANIRAGLEVTQLHAKVDTLYEQVLKRLAVVEKAVVPAPSKPAPLAPGTTAQLPPAAEP